MPDWNAIRLYSQFRQDLGPKRYGAFRTTGVDLSHWVSFGFSGVTAADRFEAPDQATKERIQALLNRIQDAYFDYNTSNIRQDAQQALHADAQTPAEILRGYPDYKLTIAGYADERGSAEYKLGLGEARAKRALQFLVDSGIPSAQLMTTSFGKERQVCTEHDESCWQKNRRIHITQAQS